MLLFCVFDWIIFFCYFLTYAAPFHFWGFFMNQNISFCILKYVFICAVEVSRLRGDRKGDSWWEKRGMKPTSEKRMLNINKMPWKYLKLIALILYSEVFQNKISEGSLYFLLTLYPPKYPTGITCQFLTTFKGKSLYTNFKQISFEKDGYHWQNMVDKQ